MKKQIVVFVILTTFIVNVQADDLSKGELAVAVIMQNSGITVDTIPSVTTQIVSSYEDQDVVTVNLQVSSLPTIHIFMKGPRGFLQDTTSTYRVCFLVSGFLTGSQSAFLLPPTPNTVYVAYDYPYNAAYLQNDPNMFLEIFRVTPAQIALSLKWISLQSWVNREKTVALGVSLGGLFLPVSLHIAQKLNAAPMRSVFAFTGADVPAIIANVLPAELPQGVSAATLFLLPAINIMNDPQLHLPALQGSFLVIRGDEDQVIPADSTAKLFELLPSPKQEVVLHGMHIDTGQTELIDETGRAVLNWLK